MLETLEPWVRSLGREDPLKKEMATHSSILTGNFHGQRSLVGYSPWSCTELNVTEHTGDNSPEHTTFIKHIVTVLYLCVSRAGTEEKETVCVCEHL